MSQRFLTETTRRPKASHISRQNVPERSDRPDDGASPLPAETRKLLDAQAAACPDDDRDDYDERNPY
jgi:hypothetical protein